MVNSANEIITEELNAGTDTVKSRVSWTLVDNLENLTLTGSSAIYGTDNALNNTIAGNSANNSLYGEAGNDNLDGAAGNDTLVGGTASNMG